MFNRIGTATALSAVALTLGCSSLPERVETLDEARELVGSLEQDSLTREVAPTRFETAQQALQRAERSYEENEDLEIIEHDAYVALRNAQIAEQQIEEQRARDELQSGEAERNRVLLQAREREAERAQELATQRGQALEQQSEQLEDRAEQLEQQEEQIQAAQQRAQQLEQERAQLAQQAEELEQELVDIQAEETDRGLVLTLDEVLFDFDGAQLKPGAESTLQRVAQFLNEHPDRNLLIEGHTDAVGDEGYNMQLSEERAAAVREALVQYDITPDRVQTRGLGESFPVASNDTDAGRQLNRRVEIVMSDEGGQFAEGAIRTASIDEEDGSAPR